MEKDDFLEDDLLRELIRQHPLDSPSDDFVERVMAGLPEMPVQGISRNSWPEILKQIFPYVLLVFVLIGVMATSDIPGFGWVPGREFLTQQVLPSVKTYTSLIFNAFSSKYVQWGLMIGVSAGFLIGIDRFFTRRSAF
ncbi:MAG TPA: hypothetical protein PKG48_00420 [Bacteroidales bacterium]|nr:hypothetical protein [Bacteroidales bacterium]HPS62459.1 hypothetical protein [Bacteroidales bacterium]